MPPTVVMRPQTVPRAQGRPRPLSTPSSDIASAKPMLMPAPTEAAMPTRKASLLVCVAKAAAKTGASVETGAVHQSREAGSIVVCFFEKWFRFGDSGFVPIRDALELGGVWIVDQWPKVKIVGVSWTPPPVERNEIIAPSAGREPR
jgi:hypothetical protein